MTDREIDFSWSGLPQWLFRPDFSDPPKLSTEPRRTLPDLGVGAGLMEKTAATGISYVTHVFQSLDRDEVFELYAGFHEARGDTYPILVPSWQPEISISSVDGNTLVASDTGYYPLWDAKLGEVLGVFIYQDDTLWVSEIADIVTDEDGDSITLVDTPPTLESEYVCGFVYRARWPSELNIDWETDDSAKAVIGFSGVRLLQEAGAGFVRVKPIISSSSVIPAYAEAGFTYQIEALNDPTSFGAAGLPEGWTIDTATGEITGTAGEEGFFKISIDVFAYNAAGVDKKTVSVCELVDVVGVSDFIEDDRYDAGDVWPYKLGVMALAEGTDGSIYVGGAFKSGDINDLDIRNPDLTHKAAPSPNEFDGVVQTIIESRNGRICVGGDFYFPLGSNLNHAVSLDEFVWDDSFFPSGLAVNQIAQSSNGTFVIVGGNSVYILSSSGSLLHTIVASTAGSVYGVAIVDTFAYVVGYFTAMGGIACNGVAKISLSSGAVTALPVDFGVSSTSYPVCIHARGNTLFIGGKFSSVNAETCYGLCAITTEGSVSGWYPHLSVSPAGTPRVLCITSDVLGNVYVGGNFTHVDGNAHGGIAKFDVFLNEDYYFQASLRRYYNESSTVSGVVHSILVRQNGRLLVGGVFDRCGDPFPLEVYGNLIELSSTGGITMPPIT